MYLREEPTKSIVRQIERLRLRLRKIIFIAGASLSEES